MTPDIGSNAGEASLIPPAVLGPDHGTVVPLSGIARTIAALKRANPFGELLGGAFLETVGKALGKPAAGTADIGLLIDIHRGHYPRAGVAELRRAYRVADQAHSGQMRKSGEPYITHPLAVAVILAELGMDTTTLIAALLHDTVEDTRYTLARLRHDFGDEVAHLVDGVTKLDKVHFGGLAEAETIRKMILAAGRDVRVLVIKLADRLHNMRTLGAKSRASQMRIATVTRDILVPLAGRLGVQAIKRELEDLVLAALRPEAYAAIDRLVAEREERRATYLAEVRALLTKAMRAERLKTRVIDRPRHYMSIYEAHGEEALPTQLSDAARVVIVTTNDADCYAALGVVHCNWRPVPGRFKDFIAAPKFNLYKSLHTTVIGPDALPLDVIIRTEDMHRVAEYGIAERCRQDLAAGGTGTGWMDSSSELQWLQRLLDWQEETASGAFLESLRYDLSDHEVLVFTSTGDAVSLPVDATPVDFAYALDTRLGDRCVGARVNGLLAPLSCALGDGDVVEVLSSPSGYAGPEREWLDFVRSSRAYVQIRRWFEEHDAGEEDLRRAGRKAIGEALVARERLLVHEQPLVAVARALGLRDVDVLYAGTARGEIDPHDVVDRVIKLVDGA